MFNLKMTKIYTNVDYLESVKASKRLLEIRRIISERKLKIKANTQTSLKDFTINKLSPLNFLSM